MLRIASVAIALLAANAKASSNDEVFTAIDMLSTPRPQPAIAAPGGQHAVELVDQWDPKSDTTTRTVYILNTADVEAKPQKVFSAKNSEIAEPIWLSDRTVAYINGSSLYHFGIDKAADTGMHLLDFPEGTEPSSLQYEPTSGTLAFSAAVWQKDGDLSKVAENDKAYEDRGYSGVVYDDLFVRHWDTWRTPGRIYTLAMTKIKRKDNEESFDTSTEFVNLLKDNGLYSQMDAIDGAWFSVSPTHVAIALKPNTEQIVIKTRFEVYYFPLDNIGARPVELTPGDQGAVTSVVFSPDGKKIAWLQMAKDGYESDKNVVIVHCLDGDKKGKSERWTDNWDRSPSSITWDHDSDSLYLIAEYNGRVLPYHIAHPNRLPTPMHFEGATQSITMLDGSKSTFLLTINSLTSPNNVYVLDLVDKDKDMSGDPDKHPREDIHQITDWASEHIAGRLNAGEEMWFCGVDDRKVMAWIIKPPGWKEGDKKKWPMAFFIHGGPQGAWEDSWSTRWNPATWASQGYFVVAVNPTGSTGYGQEFTDRIQYHWGDRPYQDLLAGYQAALEKYPEIDCDRTAALGGSYGGYMINWINGHNAFGFKALVYHDGVFDTTNMYYTTEEIWFPNQEFGGSPLTNRDVMERWNPSNFIGEWATPQLVIQGGKDYRLPDTEAIGTFTALQLQGVPSRFLYFPDENHWVLKAHNSAKWHKEVLKWLTEWVGVGEQGPSGWSKPNATTID